MDTSTQCEVSETSETSETSEPSSCGYTPKKRDSRCRAWCKVLSSESVRRIRPAGIDGANDLPGSYLPFGREVELFPGDVIFEGEANHHTKPRGWTYNLGFVVGGANGVARIVWVAGDKRAALKADLRASKNPAVRELLPGSDDVAAMVRYARAVLMGFVIPSEVV